MEVLDENPNVGKQRHGCLTAWLALIIIANSLTSIIYLFARDLVMANFQGDISLPMLILLGIIGMANIVFAIMIFQWKKLGFWGFLISAAATLIVNLSIGAEFVQSLLGLLGIGILYGVLQIKKGGITAWDNLE